MKYGDYKLATTMIDVLNLKQYLPTVYEDWCTSMLKNSKLPPNELMNRLTNKFETLAYHLAYEQGISIQAPTN